MRQNLWGVEGAEWMTAESADEAIEAVLDTCLRENWPETVTFCEYEPVAQPKIAAGDVDDVIEREFERWSDGRRFEEPADADEVPDAVREQLRVALQALADCFPVDVLCRTKTPAVTVTTLDWVREHRPEWLTEAE